MSLLKADQDGGQGDGHGAEYLRLAFHRTTQTAYWCGRPSAPSTSPS